MTGTRTGFRYSGLGVAVLGFVLTRLLVADALQSDTATFMIAGLVSLVAGMGLTVYGVGLAVGAVTPDYARTVWRWSVAGTVAMILVLATTAVHSVLTGDGFEPFLQYSVLVANVLLGGAIAGAIVGDRSAANRRTREDLVRYAERTMLVNRLLRHEIRNVVTVVEGYTTTREDDERSESASEPDGVRGHETRTNRAQTRWNGGHDTPSSIPEATERIEATVGEANTFAGTDGTLAAVDLAPALEATLAGLPDSETDLHVEGDVPPGTLVRADERIHVLLAELLENALEHPGPDATAEFSTSVDPGTVTLRVTDTGPGLPEPAKDVLSAQSLPASDDPSKGYGLQMVRLLVEHYGGDIEFDADDGTAITVTLHRTTENGVPPMGLGVPRSDVVRVSVAALVAGVVMGTVVQAGADLLPQIGGLYGIQSRIVGWVANLFHSVVFGLLFAAGCASRWLRDPGSTLRGRVALGVGWGIVLWLVAAGLVMPVWQLAVDQQATLPTLTPVGFVAHAVWGAVLGGLYATLPDPSDLLPETS